MRLYAEGDWQDAERYLVVAPLPTSRALGCFVLRSAAAEDRATDGDAEPGGGGAWRPPPTDEPRDPRARAVALRGTTAVLASGEPPTHLARLVWLERDDLLVQVLAERMSDDEVLRVAESLAIATP